MSTPLAKRHTPRSTATTRPTVSANASNIDVEDLAGQMLATLGISKQQNMRSVSGTSTSSNNMTRQTRSSRDRLSGVHGGSRTPSSAPLASNTSAADENMTPVVELGMTRATDRTPMKRSGPASIPASGAVNDSSASRLRKSSNSSGYSNASHASAFASTPLTAIRRPAQPVHLPHPSSTVNRTSTTARKVSNPPTALGSTNSPTTGRSPSVSATAKHRPSSALRGQPSAPDASSSRADPAKAAAPAGFTIPEEEYSALISLLAVKDEEIARLKHTVKTQDDSLQQLQDKCSKLEKQHQSSASSPPFPNLLSPSSNGSGKKQSTLNSEGAGITKKEYEDIKKQFEMQENLLLGFQRENEKATAEIDVLKKRERLFMEHLKKLYGPSFSAETDLSPLGNDILASRFQSTHFGNHLFSSPGGQLGAQQRRRSGNLLQFQEASETSQKPHHSDSVAGSTPLEASKEAQAPSAAFDAVALMEQLLAVQSLVQRFERRLLSRESELMKKEKEAKAEVKQARAMLDEVTV